VKLVILNSPFTVLKLYGLRADDISFPDESNNLYDTIEQPLAIFQTEEIEDADAVNTEYGDTND